MKKLLALCTAFLFLAPTNAFAHGELVAAFPAVDSTVIAAPDEVSIEFDGKLQIIGSANINLITVTDNQGQIISSPASVVEGSKISTRLQLTDITGLVTVDYRIVSQDGHPVSGTYTFTVGKTAALTGAEKSKRESTKYLAKMPSSTGLSFPAVLLIIAALIGGFFRFRQSKKR